MKKSYIKPQMEIVAIETEPLLDLVSGQGDKVYPGGVTPNDFTDIKFDNESSDDNYDFAKPNNPDLWGDEW